MPRSHLGVVLGAARRPALFTRKRTGAAFHYVPPVLRWPSETRRVRNLAQDRFGDDARRTMHSRIEYRDRPSPAVDDVPMAARSVGRSWSSGSRRMDPTRGSRSSGVRRSRRAGTYGKRPTPHERRAATTSRWWGAASGPRLMNDEPPLLRGGGALLLSAPTRPLHGGISGLSSL
jgi:hypothetical protein